MENQRYYYKKKNGKALLNLKTPKYSNNSDYIEITKEEFERLENLQQPLVNTEKQARLEEIAVLKGKLRESDYVVIKIAEGVATSEEYAEVLANRALWRARINELEN